MTLVRLFTLYRGETRDPESLLLTHSRTEVVASATATENKLSLNTKAPGPWQLPTLPFPQEANPPRTDLCGFPALGDFKEKEQFY